jgi:hypothetical protein
MADEYVSLAEDAGRDGPAFAREFFGEKRSVSLRVARARTYPRVLAR